MATEHAILADPAALAAAIGQGVVVLLKASRGAALEDVLTRIGEG